MCLYYKNSIQMKHLLLILCACLVISCGKVLMPSADICTLLTGECLESAELLYYTPESDGQQIDNNRLIFGFSLDLTHHTKQRTDETVFALKWRDIPSNDLFEKFGNNQNAIKEEFDNIFSDFSASFGERFHKQSYSIVTVLYNGGLSLTANKDFAGYPAGSNLASIVTCCPMYDNLVKESGENPVIAPAYNTPANAGGFLGIPLDYICMLKDGVEFSIPIDNHQLVEESVTFNLEIPVKVVLYLTWLNDKRTNPNASVPYKEEVLHCTFTTKFGLK